jgi:ubiquitin fusion degradation protein 1
MDFTSDEGCAYLPRWMMQNLNVKEGEKLFFAYTSLEKGSYVKLQPQTDDFLNISNPKAVLEAKLRYFTCLTRSDIIAIDYNDKIYWINVVEVKPGMAILIIDTDIDVEFVSPIIKKEDELYGSNLKINSPEYQKKNDQNKSKTEESSSEDESKDKDQKFYGKGHIVK